MKINTLVNRYLLREMLPPFVLNMVFFSLIFLMSQILEITNMIVNYHISMSTILRMVVYSLPYFMVYVLPMSVMMGILLTFLRLSNDREILALKAGGVSLAALLPAVLVFCMAGSLLTAFTTIYAMPWGQTALKRLTYEVAARHFDVGMKPGTFNNSFNGITIYVSQIDKKHRQLKDVFIEDHRTADRVQTLVAPRGRLLQDPARMAAQLRLFDGIIHQADIDSRTVNTVHFARYDINLDVQRSLAHTRSQDKDEIEMSLAELRRFLNSDAPRNTRYFLVMIEYQKKFSIPFACFALGLLAVPLGVRTRFAKRSFGLSLGLLAFLLYYLLQSAGVVFGETGKYPPVVGMWMPNVVLGGIGIFLFIRTLYERPLTFDFLQRLAICWPARLSRRSAACRRGD